MQINDYLKLRQPIIYKTFTNALKNKSLSHAYLLVGQKGTPLLDVATYMAKTILCDEPAPFACLSCITCSRIEEGNYPDFILFNGEEGSIKKSQIDDLESNFEKKAFEQKGIKVYVLHLVENMTVQAVNALLKFLEEPGKEIYAFLTTNNESIILPTIISRCQTLHLKFAPRSEIIQSAINLGVLEEDAQLLSYFYNDEDLLKNASEDDKDYLEAKESLKQLLLDLIEDENKAIYNMQKHIAPSLSNKESVKFFIDMLIEVYEDVQAIKHGKSPVLKSFIEILNNISEITHNVDEIIIELLKIKNCLNINVNSALLLDHLILYITKGA